MRGPKSSSASPQPTVILLFCLTLAFSVLLVSIQSSFFAGKRKYDIKREEISILSDFQSLIQQCVVWLEIVSPFRCLCFWCTIMLEDWDIDYSAVVQKELKRKAMWFEFKPFL